MLEKATRTVGCLMVALAVTACGGGGGKDPLDHALDFAMEGTYADIDGLAAEFDGESDIVAVDFGDSVMGTNSSVFKLGDPLVTEVSCGEDSCTGQVVVPQVDESGTLTGFTRETATMTKEGDNVIVQSAFHGERVFKPWTKPAGTDEGDGELKSDATCPEWWAVMKSKASWKVTYLDRIGGEPHEPQGISMTFFGDNEFTVSGDIDTQMGWGGFTNGYIIFDENFGGTGMCRVYIHSDVGHSLDPWFGYSYSNGKLVFKLTYDPAQAGYSEIHLE